MTREDKLVFIFGATGTGKTDASVCIARYLRRVGYDAVAVLNCDVLQFYKGLPIATNKAPAESLVFDDGTPIPHFLLSFVSWSSEGDTNGTSEYRVHDFVRDASKLIHDFFSRSSEEGKKCALLVCGGSHYYLEALLTTGGLVVDAVNERIEGTAAAPATQAKNLWTRLQAIDAHAASLVHPNNTRRVARLLEVAERNGGTLPSEIYRDQLKQLRWREPTDPSLLLLWIDGDLQWLIPRLEARVDDMMRNGLAEEVVTFAEQLRAESATNRCSRKENVEKRTRSESDTEPHNDDAGGRGAIAEAIGFKEWLPYISLRQQVSQDCTTSPLDVCLQKQLDDTERMCVDQVKSHTRRYAKQQVQWIKNRIITPHMLNKILKQPRYRTISSSNSGASTVTMEDVPVLRVSVDRCSRSAVPLDRVMETIVKRWLATEPHHNESSVPTNVNGICASDDAKAFDVLSGLIEDVRLHQDLQHEVSDRDAERKAIHYCELCDKHLAGALQWDVHLKSKGHRGAMRHVALVEQQRGLGREIPPRKTAMKQAAASHHMLDHSQ